MSKFGTYSLLMLTLFFYSSESAMGQIVNISWVDQVSGDFSFKEHWDYPEGVYRNDFGQLSCDGFCPQETERMKDENGKIFKDSLHAFYQLVDTTHQFHSIRSEAWCYEWAGTNFVTAKKRSRDSVLCFTHTNAATHSSLSLTITNDKCVPTILLNSLALSTEAKIYTCKSGQIEIDKGLWEKGILKARFHFTFDHKENPRKPMYWKGKIYANLESE